MHTRLFTPLGMRHTTIEIDHALVEGGKSATGLPVQPWVMDAYAPGAAAVSTTGDLAKLRDRDSSPDPLRHVRPRANYLLRTSRDSRIGNFWEASAWETGQTITSHAGQSGGYASYLGIRPPPTQGRDRPVRRRQRRQRSWDPAPPPC